MKNPPRILLTAAITVILQFTPNLLAQTKSATIDSLLTLCYERGQFNGSALVAQNGKVIFRKGYGMANFDWKIPNAPDTKHRIASITKQSTAMLIMQLVVKTFCSGDLKFEPGSQYRYNNSGYYILGLIIERVTGKSYTQVLEENILKPAGMRDSGIDDEKQILPNRSQGYIPSETAECLRGGSDVFDSGRSVSLGPGVV